MLEDKNINQEKKPETNNTYEKIFFEIDAKQIKNYFTLMNITTDSCLRLIFEPHNMKCTAVDPAQVELIESTINESLFYVYHIETNIDTSISSVTIGIDAEKILNILKTIKKGDKMSFSYDSSADACNITIKTGMFTHNINLVDQTELPETKIPFLELTTKFDIDTQTLLDFLNQADDVSDHFIIIADSSEVQLKAAGAINKVECTPEIKNLFSADKIRAAYSIDYVLTTIKDIKNLFKTVTINTKTEDPIRIIGDQYINGGTGFMNVQILIAPRIECE